MGSVFLLCIFQRQSAEEERQNQGEQFAVEDQLGLA